MIPLRPIEIPEKKTKQLNVTFGLSTEGEIFVDVGGQQYTPDANFYKQIAHQTAILASQVVDLDKENMRLKSENQDLKGKVKELEYNVPAIALLYDALKLLGEDFDD